MAMSLEVVPAHAHRKVEHLVVDACVPQKHRLRGLRGQLQCWLEEALDVRLQAGLLLLASLIPRIMAQVGAGKAALSATWSRGLTVGGTGSQWLSRAWAEEGLWAGQRQPA